MCSFHLFLKLTDFNGSIFRLANFNSKRPIPLSISISRASLGSADVPLSKSLFVWRLMHGKVPSDDNLMIRGCNFPSMCNLCFNHMESSFHIFFTCLEDVWKICDLSWSPQCKVVVLSALMNLFNTIWYARN